MLIKRKKMIVAVTSIIFHPACNFQNPRLPLNVKECKKIHLGKDEEEEHGLTHVQSPYV